MNTDGIQDNDSPGKPTLKIIFDGKSPECIEYLRERSMSGIWPDKLEVTFRSQPRNKEIDAEGILGVANPAGEYLLELKTSRRQIFDFVTAVHRYADATNNEVQYYLWIEAEDGLVMDWAENMLIVFTINGEVVRHRSLLPPELDM